MAVVWVRAGVCEKETTIAAQRSDMTHVRLTFDTTCEHVQKLAEQLTELDVASEMSIPRNESRTCRLATEYLCRNSCIVPAAILKAVEVEMGLFLPAESRIEFVEGAV
jgi:hypothetical protein